MKEDKEADLYYYPTLLPVKETKTAEKLRGPFRSRLGKYSQKNNKG